MKLGEEAVPFHSGCCISSLFVYFLSGVNIHAWLQPSHLHMSSLCTITQTSCTQTHTHARRHKLSCAHTLSLTIQPFKPHLNPFLCINPTHKVSGTSQTKHSTAQSSTQCVRLVYYFSKTLLFDCNVSFYALIFFLKRKHIYGEVCVC